MKLFYFDIRVCIFWISLYVLGACNENFQESIIDPNDDIDESQLVIPLINEELNLINYLGNTENIHPKVLYFKDGWNGYSFWMAYTPYPLGDINAENPCIAVSNDGINWGIPLGLVNPLAETPDHGYNSDTHLVYNPKTDSIECWWREVDTSDKDIDAFYKRVSKDGVVWTDKEVVYNFDPDNRCRLSPAVCIVDEMYYMVISDCVNLYYLWGKSIPEGGIEWSKPQMLEVPFVDNKLNLWHQDMIIDNDYNVEMIVCAFDRSKNENNNSADLYMLEYNLKDVSSISDLKLIKSRSPYLHSITNRSIYRSSLVKINDMYMVYISSIDNNWHRHLMIATGHSLLQLVDSSL